LLTFFLLSSSTVPEDEVAAHVLRCSAAKQAREVRDQPYFQKGVNAGDESDKNGESSGGVLSSRENRALLERLSDQEFWEFLDKVSALLSGGPRSTLANFRNRLGIIVWRF
jgi:hypothetical protein